MTPIDSSENRCGRAWDGEHALFQRGGKALRSAAEQPEDKHRIESQVEKGRKPDERELDEVKGEGEVVVLASPLSADDERPVPVEREIVQAQIEQNGERDRDEELPPGAGKKKQGSQERNHYEHVVL